MGNYFSFIHICDIENPIQLLKTKLFVFPAVVICFAVQFISNVLLNTSFLAIATVSLFLGFSWILPTMVIYSAYDVERTKDLIDLAKRIDLEINNQECLD